MKRITFFTAAVLALSLQFGCSGGTDAKTTGATSEGGGGSSVSLPSEATLRLKAKEGDKYTMVTTVETGANLPTPDGKTENATMNLTVTEESTCTKVEDGKMTWESKNVDVQATGTGPFQAQAQAAQDSEKGKTQTKVRDERNQLVGETKDESLTLAYPEKAVKPGDTWKGETELMGAKTQVEFKLDRFEVVNGKTAAVIVATISGQDRLKSTAPLTLYVDIANGWPIKGEGSFEMRPQPGITATMKVSMSAK